MKHKEQNVAEMEQEALQQAAEQKTAIRALMQEARSTYQHGSLHAANDFFTVHVPPSSSPPSSPLSSTSSISNSSSSGQLGEG
jgi:hypothetical protein